MKTSKSYLTWPEIKTFELSANKIHFWLIKLPTQTAKVDRELLTQLKKERRQILKNILQNYLSEPFNLLENSSGKPYLENNHLEFNTSHSGSYLAIAISKSPIGIDIEKFKIRNFIHFSERFFENDWAKAHLISLKPYLQGLAFFKQWSITEAWVKMLGVTIFNFPQMDTENFHFLSFQPKVGLTATLCQKHPIDNIEVKELDWSHPDTYHEELLRCFEKDLKISLQTPSLEIKWLDTIDSTQNYIKKILNPPMPFICLSESQTQGKGRLGREWISPKGVNIYCSMLWDIQRPAMELGGFSLVVALAIIKTLNHELQIKTQVKWPNDIYYQGKKLAGILIELFNHSPLHSQVIIGIGINVNATQSMLPSTATSLYEINQEIHDRKQLLKMLSIQLQQNIQKFEKGGFQGFQADWFLYDMLYQKEVSITQGTRIIHGRAEGVNSQGYLIIRDSENNLHEVGSGEASIQSFQK